MAKKEAFKYGDDGDSSGLGAMGECRNVQGAQHCGVIIDSTSCKNLGADLPTKIECSRLQTNRLHSRMGQAPLPASGTDGRKQTP